MYTFYDIYIDRMDVSLTQRIMPTTQHIAGGNQLTGDAKTINDAYQSRFGRDAKPEEISNWQGTGKSMSEIQRGIQDHGGPSQASIDQGMFGFQEVMDDFYNYKPGEDDSEGRAIKNNFQANLIQSGFDAALSKDMAYQQQEIGQENMNLAANLELRNTNANMKEEFNYGMQSMGAQYGYQDKFANNQYDRDLGTLAATGE